MTKTMSGECLFIFADLRTRRAHLDAHADTVRAGDVLPYLDPADADRVFTRMPSLGERSFDRIVLYVEHRSGVIAWPPSPD